MASLEGSPEALWFIGQFRRLYQIEDEVRHADPPQRRNLRLQQAPPFWRAMKRRAHQLQADPRFLPQSTLAKAVRYFLHEHTALVAYLRDGRFEIDNNLVENAIRGPCVGKKRWLFIGHPDAGWRSAVIYSLMLSCRRRGINPQDYLTDRRFAGIELLPKYAQLARDRIRRAARGAPTAGSRTPASGG